MAKHRSKSKAKAKRLALTEVYHGAIAFTIVAGMTCFMFSLLGNVMVEKARRDSIRSVERARYAARESAVLREQVQSLTNAYAIDEWARANGFAAASAPSESSH